MTTTRAAKYLAPIDLGKTIQLLDRYTGNWPTGTLQEIDATQDSLIRLTIIAGKDSGTYDVHPEDEITITGKPSPTRQGEQPNTVHVRIEPKISAGQRIGQSGNAGHTTLDAALGTYCGHNGGQGIGAGHTCTCTRGAHHDLDSERPHGCPCGASWKD